MSLQGMPELAILVTTSFCRDNQLRFVERKVLLFKCTMSGYPSYSTPRLYVGNLPWDVTEREVEDLFYKVRNWRVETSLHGMHVFYVI